MCKFPWWIRVISSWNLFSILTYSETLCTNLVQTYHFDLGTVVQILTPLVLDLSINSSTRWVICVRYSSIVSQRNKYFVLRVLERMDLWLFYTRIRLVFWNNNSMLRNWFVFDTLYWKTPRQSRRNQAREVSFFVLLTHCNLVTSYGNTYASAFAQISHYLNQTGH